MKKFKVCSVVLFFPFVQGLILHPWVAWNLLYTSWLSSDWLWTHRDPPILTSWDLGSKVCAIKLSCSLTFIGSTKSCSVSLGGEKISMQSCLVFIWLFFLWCLQANVPSGFNVPLCLVLGWSVEISCWEEQKVGGKKMHMCLANWRKVKHHKNIFIGGCSDGSAIKSVCSSWRELEFPAPPSGSSSLL